MKPILCNYYITYRCNARCQFCDIWHAPEYRNIPDCSMADVTKNLTQIKKIGVRFIDFTGGEPLLHPQLPEMLALAKRAGLRTSVTTNCLLYPSRADELRGLIDLLHFSLDSMNPEMHDALRGGRTFDAVIESIDIAKQLGETPDLLFTVTPENVDAIDALSAFACKQRLMLIVNPIFNYGNQPILTSDILNILDHYRFKPYVYINAAQHELMRAGGNDPQRPRCYAVSSSVVISPDNHLLLPCFHLAIKRIPIQGDLANVMVSDEYQRQQRLEGRHEFCAGCTINCYFDPSFLYRLDRYFFLSLLSKMKYGYDKYIRRHLA
jgi:MoaA/NifB/PqqE/SkfB family radical SAM enzyme